MLEGDFYPGGHGVDHFELKNTVGKTVGPASGELEVSWIPDQENYAGDSVYVGAGAEVAVADTPLSLHARGGREDGNSIEKWDWEAGVSHSFEELTASLAYVDSNYGGVSEVGRLGRAGVVVSILAEYY